MIPSASCSVVSLGCPASVLICLLPVSGRGVLSVLPVPAAEFTLHLQGLADGFDTQFSQSGTACRRQYSNSAFWVVLPQLVLNCWTRKLSKQAETKQHLESLINMYAGYRCTQRTQDTELVVSAYNSASANTAAARQSVRHRSAKPMNAPQC